LTNEMQARFFDRLDAAEADPAVRVVVVTGAGRGFCAGAEMELLQTIGTNAGISAPTRNVDQVRQLEASKPIIAAINGPCAGLGFVLACMADIRFATRDAKLTSAFAKRGLVAEHGISWVLPRVVGMSNAMDLLLSSRVVLGTEAKEMGLVTRVFDTPELLLAETLAYAREMSRCCSPASLAEIKAQLVRHANVSAREAFADSYGLMMRSFRHPDSKEGVASYVEKRDPRFQGLTAGRIGDM
jgi:enoyl-CoA hydratase/carnithine racemase